MTKVYVASHDKSIDNKIAETLEEYFGDKVKVMSSFMEKPLTPYDGYEIELNNILSSQILICALDGHETENVTRALSVFTSSLDTLKELRVRHTPKLIVGLPMFDEQGELSDQMMYIIGGIYAWGTMAHTQEDMLELVENYIDGNPLF